MEGIGSKLKERARQLGLSDAEVARRCDITARRYSYYAKNQREAPFWFVKRVCSVLAVDPNYLFDYEGDDGELKKKVAELEKRMNQMTQQSTN